MKRKRTAALLVVLAFTASCISTEPEGKQLNTQDRKKDKTADQLTAKPAAPSIGHHEMEDQALYRTSGEGALKSMMYTPQPEWNTESYKYTEDNSYFDVKNRPLSTFSIDVDTASYSNSRRFLNNGSLPPADAIRAEEFINYFSYNYPATRDKNEPFSIHTEIADCPWNEGHKLALIGIQGARIEAEKMPARNLVFLVDTSGSMEDENKLPLLRKAFKALSATLTSKDSIAIVAYAGSAGLVLPATPGNHKEKILASLDSLSAGGSTNGGEGIELAYKVAQENFIRKGVNRVILATDGDFNVGNTSEGGLTRLIEKKRESGIFLTVLGSGMGNYKDSTMETLADKGNGNYAYIDTFAEAKRALVDQASATLVTIAKDVKIQVEFNPDKVASYRLIGYENRVLKDEDFNDDKKDAGDIGAGHSVTALYEIVPVGMEKKGGSIDPLRYQTPAAIQPVKPDGSDEWMYVKIRYKAPDGDNSNLILRALKGQPVAFARASSNLQWASAAASFAMVMRDSDHKGSADYDFIIRTAKSNLGEDNGGYRAEFLRLVHIAKGLKS